MKSRYSSLTFEPPGQVGRVSVVMQIYTQIYKLLLLFIENILGVLIG